MFNIHKRVDENIMRQREFRIKLIYYTKIKTEL